MLLIEMMNQDAEKSAMRQQEEAYEEWMSRFHKDDIVTIGGAESTRYSFNKNV